MKYEIVLKELINICRHFRDNPKFLRTQTQTQTEVDDLVMGSIDRLRSQFDEDRKAELKIRTAPHVTPIQKPKTIKKARSTRSKTASKRVKRNSTRRQSRKASN